MFFWAQISYLNCHCLTISSATLSRLIFVYLEHIVREVGLNLGWVYARGKWPNLELLPGVLRPAQIIVCGLKIIAENVLRIDSLLSHYA